MLSAAEQEVTDNLTTRASGGKSVIASVSHERAAEILAGMSIVERVSMKATDVYHGTHQSLGEIIVAMSVTGDCFVTELRRPRIQRVS